jgi:CheY-like chemotaxis protein
MKSEKTARMIREARDAMRRRIMCVDDNGYFLTAMCRFLAKCGHEATQVKKGAEAIGLVQAKPDHYDAIIVDDSISDLDGVKLVRSLRDCGFRGRVFIKASNLPPTRQEAYGLLGVCAVVEIPVDPYKLLQLIQAPAGETRE